MTLYDRILKAINESVLNALNEYINRRFENADHRRGSNIPDLKFLTYVLINEYGYKVSMFSPTKDKPYLLVIRREDNVRRQVYVQLRRKETTTGNLALKLRGYKETQSLLDNPEIDEFCFICPPVMNYTATNSIVDNTKACFFDKSFIIEKINDGTLKIEPNKNGEVVLIKESWLKANAKQVVSYKYKK